jgi:asparagine synthase (glutamine-hydrolysing)
MCGIAGVISKGGSKNLRTEIEAMLAKVQHRGPDGQGVFVTDTVALGHTRLAIIDLSDSGRQPMCYLDRYVITFNGEIYNYLELKNDLKARGYSFKSQSDTEVILAAYAEWGLECVSRLNGMFAFGIYDMLEHTLFLSRDRVGEKPLYYCNLEDSFYFFSEPKQVVLTKLVRTSPNHKAIREYLEYQFSLGNETFFNGIYKLMPGHSAVLSKEGLAVSQYWNIDEIEVNDSILFADANAEIRRLVSESVKMRLRSDVKVASYLSGGIDSTVIASLAAKEVSELPTFTFTSKQYPQFDESNEAKATASILKSNHNEIEMGSHDFLSLWKSSVYFMDEPEVGFSLLSQMVVSQKVANYTKVVLGGQGGDELFFGYGWYNSLILKSLFRKIPDLKLYDKLKIIWNFLVSAPIFRIVNLLIDSTCSWQRTVAESYLSLWRSYGCFDLLTEPSEDAVPSSFPLCGDCSLSSLKKFEFKFWLQGLLHVEDRSSMATSLESRVPLLDHRLIEYVFSLPPVYMINGRLNKHIFVDAFRDLIPSHIADAKQKKGYVSPAHIWFSEPAVENFIYSVLHSKDSFIYNFVNFEKIGSQTLSARQIWALISLEMWYRIFFVDEELFSEDPT